MSEQDNNQKEGAGQSAQAGLAKETDDLPPIYRYFLYFEMLTIVLFLPIILTQIIVAYDFFNYIGMQTKKYHYYFVTSRIIPPYYMADFKPMPRREVETYLDQYINNCESGYNFNDFLTLFDISYATPEEITDKIQVPDPDYNVTKLWSNSTTTINKTVPATLDVKARNFRFYKFDVGRRGNDPSKYRKITLSTGINFIEWKGKRYCQKRINFNTDYMLLQIIPGNKNCTTMFSYYDPQDCGTYFTGTYRICALKSLAISSKGQLYGDVVKLMNQTSNICPVTNMEFVDDPDPSKIQIIPTTKNQPTRKGNYDLYAVIYTDMVTMQNYMRDAPGDYDMSTYNDGCSMNITNDYSFGFNDYNNIGIDSDSFMNFINYTTNSFTYYKGYLNGTQGNALGSEFYMPYDSQGTGQAVLACLIIRAVTPQCYKGVFLELGDTTLFGPTNKLNVSSFFTMALTILIWTCASIFLGIYAKGNIRFRIIYMKLESSLNVNNKNSEEISKWTSTMFWFIIFAVKMIIVGLMISTVSNQIKISKLMVDSNCYIDKVVIVFTVFRRFLDDCKAKLETLVYFLIIEFILEIFVIAGHLVIWIQRLKQEILLEMYTQKLLEEEKKKDQEKEKLL